MIAASSTAPEHRRCLLQSSPQFGKPLSITPESIQSEFGNDCDHNLVRDNRFPLDASPHPPCFCLRHEFPGTRNRPRVVLGHTIQPFFQQDILPLADFAAVNEETITPINSALKSARLSGSAEKPDTHTIRTATVIAVVYRRGFFSEVVVAGPLVESIEALVGDWVGDGAGFRLSGRAYGSSQGSLYRGAPNDCR